MDKAVRHMIEGCIKQQRAAQSELYNQYASKMLAVLYRYAKGQDEAQDMLQEGFIKVFGNMHKYTFKGSFEGWIRRIMVNTAIDFIRKNKKHQLNQEITDTVAESTTDPEIDHLELEYLYTIIQELPRGYQMVFNLYAIEGYTHKEIGTKLNITESTSRSQYTRAKSMLRQRIKKDDMEYNFYQDAI